MTRADDRARALLWVVAAVVWVVLLVGIASCASPVEVGR